MHTVLEKSKFKKQFFYYPGSSVLFLRIIFLTSFGKRVFSWIQSWFNHSAVLVVTSKYLWQSLAETHFLLNAQSPSLSLFSIPFQSETHLFFILKSGYILNTVFLGKMPHHFHQSYLYFKSWSPRRPCKRRSSLGYDSLLQIHIPTLIYFIYQDTTF